MVLARLKSSYIKSVYYSICDDYCLNANKIWMNGDWFYMAEYSVFDDGGKTTQRSPADSKLNALSDIHFRCAVIAHFEHNHSAPHFWAKSFLNNY